MEAGRTDESLVKLMSQWKVMEAAGTSKAQIPLKGPTRDNNNIFLTCFNLLRRLCRETISLSRAKPLGLVLRRKTLLSMSALASYLGLYTIVFMCCILTTYEKRLAQACLSTSLPLPLTLSFYSLWHIR